MAWSTNRGERKAAPPQHKPAMARRQVCAAWRTTNAINPSATSRKGQSPRLNACQLCPTGL
eukprot:12043827-Alexandrium_andersonii.AAC.1